MESIITIEQVLTTCLMYISMILIPMFFTFGIALLYYILYGKACVNTSIVVIGMIFMVSTIMIVLPILVTYVSLINGTLVDNVIFLLKGTLITTIIIAFIYLILRAVHRVVKSKKGKLIN